MQSSSCMFWTGFVGCREGHRFVKKMSPTHRSSFEDVWWHGLTTVMMLIRTAGSSDYFVTLWHLIMLVSSECSGHDGVMMRNFSRSWAKLWWKTMWLNAVILLLVKCRLASSQLVVVVVIVIMASRQPCSLSWHRYLGLWHPMPKFYCQSASGSTTSWPFWHTRSVQHPHHPTSAITSDLAKPHISSVHPPCHYFTDRLREHISPTALSDVVHPLSGTRWTLKHYTVIASRFKRRLKTLLFRQTFSSTTWTVRQCLWSHPTCWRYI